MILSLFCFQNFVLVLLARGWVFHTISGRCLCWHTLESDVEESEREEYVFVEFFSEFTRWEIFQEMSMCDCYLGSKAVRWQQKRNDYVGFDDFDICLVYFRMLDILIQSETKRYRSIIIKKCLAVSGSARLRVCIRLYHPIIVASFLGVSLFVSSTLSSLLLRILLP